MIFFYALHYTRGLGFDHQVFEPSFPSFLLPFHPGLRYVHVLRPPLDHEIRCYLWQPLLRLVFGIWLIYKRRPISSSERCFFFMLGGDLVMDVDNCFILWMIFDIVWFPLLLCISYHTGAYSPFIWLRWAPTSSLGIFTDQRSLMEYVEMIAVLVKHCWAHWRFSWF